MRWVRFTAESRTEFGIMEDDVIQAVEGSPFATYEMTQRRYDLADVELEVPVIPRTFYAVGFNYLAHVQEIGGSLANVPSRPDVGYRANNALIAHEQPVIIPADAEVVHFEGELVAVIGKQAKSLSEHDALDCVLGYTIGNDVSERVWQDSDRTLWRAKNTDTFKPMGPWIETDVNLSTLETVVRLNGEERSRFRTNDMVFGVATYISAISQYITLHPGDVLWMGTDGTSPNLVPGDEVEVEIVGIGALRNPFRAHE